MEAGCIPRRVSCGFRLFFNGRTKGPSRSTPCFAASSVGGSEKKGSTVPRADGRRYDSDDDAFLYGLALHALCPALYLAGGVVFQMRGLGAHTGSFYPFYLR